jgi:two-component system, NarL family, sensor histidine kinase UhpB
LSSLAGLFGPRIGMAAGTMWMLMAVEFRHTGRPRRKTDSFLGWWPIKLRRLSPASLFWRVFLVNAVLVTAAVFLLAVTPLTVSDPATTSQLLYLSLGLIVLLAANVALLRVSLQPLQRLTQLMGRIDLLQPGDRLEVSGARELNLVSSGFNDMLDRLEQERQVSSSRSLGREEEERRRLAGELHDQLGQGMTALLLQLKTVMDEAPQRLRGELMEAQTIARGNLDEVRRIARRLRPTVLDDLGLAYALLALADAAQEQTEISIVRRVDAETPQVSEAAELVLYRIAQESLTNAIRHASASQVELVFGVIDAGRTVELAVHDDGRGMLYATGVEGGGIRGMRERALTIGAELVISSRAGSGTSITVKVPVKR